MSRLLLFLLFASTCYGVDYNIFKNCSEVEFCDKLRGVSSKENYHVDSWTVDNGNTLNLVLSQSGKDVGFNVAISAIEEKTIRIKITEANKKRYELKDVLEKEPEKKRIIVVDDQESLTLSTGNNLVIVNLNKFEIRVLNASGEASIILDGKNLIFDESSNAFSFSVLFGNASALYGLHEHASNLALLETGIGRSDPFRLRNLDVPSYEDNSTMALYGAVPVIYAHSTDATSGIFLHNAAEQWYDIQNDRNGIRVQTIVESGSLDLFIFNANNPAEVVRQYVNLTGVAHLPQLWTLGYHQCRWNYESQEDVQNVVANFDNYNFQMDAIWLDIEYSDGKKYFTWNPENFTDPVKMQQNISSTNRKLVVIIDPHIKVEKDYPVYSGALERDLYVKDANGKVFEGDCWPGLSSYMDFLNPEARSYYANWYLYENFNGSTEVLSGIWNDMNEPSVFDDSLEKTMPGDNLHYGNVAHRDIHNIYGLLHTMSTHEGLMKRDNGTKRPFILTRSHFAGSQRYTAFWTGDNTADWGYLRVSYSECLNSNLLGLVFCGADVGGFFGDPEVELVQRWYQAGVWLPFYRAHANMGTLRREPYLFPEDVQEIIRNSIQLRYKHLPVWYTLFYEHTRNKDPVIRPLFYQYPKDSNTFNIDEQLLVGEGILVRAVATPKVSEIDVYFPGGKSELWYSIFGNDVHEGGNWESIKLDNQSIPVYYKSGQVIVRKDVVRKNSVEMANDGHTLYIALDSNGRAHGRVYLDDHTSFNYVNSLEYNYLSIDVDHNDIQIRKIDEYSNSDDFPFILEKVVFNVIDHNPKNGNPGSYHQIVFEKDYRGINLKDLKFDGISTVNLKLG